MTTIYPHSTPEVARRRRDVAPTQQGAFEAFARRVAHVTQCSYCINEVALRVGATPEELMEAISVAAEMRAGGDYAHLMFMFAALAEEEEKRNRSSR